MKFTNINNIHKTLVDYVVKTTYPPQPNRIGPTELINNPLIRLLKVKHWNDLTADVSEFLWSIYGTSIHSQLEKYNTENVIKELKLVLPFGNWTVAGKLDIFDLTGPGILDHKTTSVWSVVYDHPDWAKQLNIYKAMAVKMGLPEAKKLTVLPFLRDWVSSKAGQDDNYPKCQAMIVPVDSWPLDKCNDYINDRLKLYNQTEDQILATPCTPEERWAKPTTYAVKKKGSKTAMRGGVCQTKEDAEAFIARQKPDVKGQCQIEVRKGCSTKCERFCAVREFCPHRSKFVGE